MAMLHEPSLQLLQPETGEHPPESDGKPNLEVEGKAPDLVIELTSRHTRIEDLGNKRVICANMGVREYFIFDPLGEAFPTPLRGFRLEGTEYILMTGTRLRTQVLGLELVVEEDQLRLYDPQTGERLRTHEEAEAARREAEAKAAEEAEARRAAEAELERMREELARLQSQKPE